MAIDIKKLDLKKIETIFAEIKTIKHILEMQNEIIEEYEAYFTSENKQNLNLITEALKTKFEELNNAYKICIVADQAKNIEQEQSQNNEE